MLKSVQVLARHQVCCIGSKLDVTQTAFMLCLIAVDQLISGIAECRNLPRSSYVDGKPQVALYGNHLKWITFSFESVGVLE